MVWSPVPFVEKDVMITYLNRRCPGVPPCSHVIVGVLLSYQGQLVANEHMGVYFCLMYWLLQLDYSMTFLSIFFYHGKILLTLNNRHYSLFQGLGAECSICTQKCWLGRSAWSIKRDSEALGPKGKMHTLMVYYHQKGFIPEKERIAALATMW